MLPELIKLTAWNHLAGQAVPLGRQEDPEVAHKRRKGSSEASSPRLWGRRSLRIPTPRADATPAPAPGPRAPAPAAPDPGTGNTAREGAPRTPAPETMEALAEWRREGGAQGPTARDNASL